MLPLLSRIRMSVSAEMVEAPGTAPGSALPISQHVYRHSRRTGTSNIRPAGRHL